LHQTTAFSSNTQAGFSSNTLAATEHTNQTVRADKAANEE
jgi:hypothetical protein